MSAFVAEPPRTPYLALAGGAAVICSIRAAQPRPLVSAQL